MKTNLLLGWTCCWQDGLPPCWVAWHLGGTLMCLWYIKLGTRKETLKVASSMGTHHQIHEQRVLRSITETHLLKWSFLHGHICFNFLEDRSICLTNIGQMSLASGMLFFKSILSQAWGNLCAWAPLACGKTPCGHCTFLCALGTCPPHYHCMVECYQLRVIVEEGQTCMHVFMSMQWRNVYIHKYIYIST